MKKIKDLQGGAISKVELVENYGEKLVLRTSNPDDIINEKYFQKQLALHNIPHIKMYHDNNLSKNQILLEYIEGSPTLRNYIICYLNNKQSQESLGIIKKWGELMKQVHSVLEPKIKILNTSGEQILTWHEAIDREIAYGIERQKTKINGLDEEHVKKIVSKILLLKQYYPKKICLLHCDPHENNVLIKSNKQLVFIDKQADFISGDPLFDTAIIALRFIGGVDGCGDLGTECDKAYLEAFMSGYGEDFRQHTYFKEFLLMRCLTRYPNNFTPYLHNVMERFS